MNLNIDLRSAEYKASIRLIKTGTLKFACLAIIFLLPPLLLVGLEIYCENLRQNNATLEAEVISLTENAAPLVVISGNLEETRAVLELEKQLSAYNQPWSSYLREIRVLSPRSLSGVSIIINPGVNIEITGNSTDMQAPAYFRESIASLPFTDQTELKTLAMHNPGGYIFSITANFPEQKKDEQDDH